MQKKASIPPCFSTVLGGKTGGTVPEKGEHSVFFFCFSFSVCNAMQYNTMQYNTIQYTTTPVPKNRRHSPTLEKALCPAPFLAYGILWRSPCHPAAAEGAKLSKCAAAGLSHAYDGVPDPARNAMQGPGMTEVMPNALQRLSQTS